MRKITNNQYPITRRMLRIAGGFTIIETLVAITVLMIAIAGPLVVASKGLSAALYARDQVIGSYLAQESMEVIKNQRDNNLYANGSSLGGSDVDWLDQVATVNGGVRECTSTNSPCDASALNKFYNGCNGDATIAPIGCKISFDRSTGYTPVPSDETTVFTRYYYVTQPDGTTPCASASDNLECQVHVVVSWNEGTVPYEVDLDSEIVNNLR